MDTKDYSQHTPGSLPKPVVDSGVESPNGEQLGAQNPITSQQDVSQSQPQSVPAQPQVPVSPDSDVIDPAWVAQVDTVIKRTVADPRLLSQEFAKLKAQYIAGRYGRELKQIDGKE